MVDTVAESAFVRRLAAAARAAWWTLLVGIGVALAQFIAYECFQQCEGFGQWVTGLLGVDTPTARLLFLGFILLIRLFIVLLLLGCVFLSLWVRRLRRLGAA